ncbi:MULTISPECIES: hypothetical protein [unclassified Streptomyces]|uniref:hypothetical protein n=1 Tax=unclassified Streptomyces TaxID=2593676 RepID=UPI00081EAC70|nr:MULTISPECIES: hypothetical protein [unclassified Streptomyces]MYR27783.1 hypothetical protein [Streptomyces sp. SID4945]SCF29319.1 hypothetical protein GA0115257_11036 [Streptomyces sp. LcepLS]
MDQHTPAPVERYAAATADAACDLSDALTPALAWTQAALEDVVEAVELLTQLLAEHGPAAAHALAQMPGILTRLCGALDLEEASASPARPRTTRPGRRGLGPGYQGITTAPVPRARRPLGAGGRIAP